MITEFLVIKARLDKNIENEFEIINLGDPGISDCFSSEEVVPDIDTGLDDDQDKADHLNDAPYCFINCDFSKYLHTFVKLQS